MLLALLVNFRQQRCTMYGLSKARIAGHLSMSFGTFEDVLEELEYMTSTGLAFAMLIDAVLSTCMSTVQTRGLLLIYPLQY